MEFLWVCAGGAAGSGARYLLTVWTLEKFKQPFPIGTVSVNLVGSFLMGIVMVLGLEARMLSPTARIALTTGVLGGFTTYSAFNYETVKLMQDGDWRHAFLNVSVTLVGGLIAGFAGMAVGRAWVPR